MALVRPLLIVTALALLALPLRSHAGGATAAGNLHPLVLLEAMLTAAYVPPAPACVAGQKQGWFQLQAPCFADQMSLVFDAGADDYRNSDGVATRVPFFGSTRSLIG
ncbi:hypothetical protein HU200_025346 [Digitaria exilis]|uniref:Uncharacterized protein n=1 Tax=Digitaria exilis TaxID=1010633 RepID=A0A835EVC0_9POAL|nr:hypothetical protein HU200_025346 [Digitaria exilis]